MRRGLAKQQRVELSSLRKGPGASGSEGLGREALLLDFQD